MKQTRLFHTYAVEDFANMFVLKQLQFSEKFKKNRALLYLPTKILTHRKSFSEVRIEIKKNGLRSEGGKEELKPQPVVY